MRQCVFFTDEIAQINLKKALWITVDSSIHNEEQLFRQISNQAPEYVGIKWNWDAFRDDITGWDYLPPNTYERVVMYHPDSLLLAERDLNIYIEDLIETMVRTEKNIKDWLPDAKERGLPNQVIAVFQKSDWQQYKNNGSILKRLHYLGITKDDIEQLRGELSVST
ncbi:hypothetical protein PT286_03465 [Neisseriaceae bacterium ESL0693]|nr:hypothetical protein [Neisseriaceae bacterium ESL0693]